MLYTSGEAGTRGGEIKQADLWASVPRPRVLGEEASVPAQFSQRGSSAWEHGDRGQPLMSLLLPDCLQMATEVWFNTLLVFAVKQTSNCPQVWLSAFLEAVCPVYSMCLQHADWLDKIRPSVYL